jgi:hypothetical protein
MTGRAWQKWLHGLAAATFAALLLFAATPSARRNPRPPTDSRERALWLAEHPADWQTATRLSDQVLQTTLPRRLEVWRAAYDHAAALTPRHDYARSAFVRGGLFYWPELSDADRKQVLADAELLLADQPTFDALHDPLWRLTGDFGVIRRGAPKNLSSLSQLRELTAREGLFAEYREVREALRAMRLAELEARKESATPVELFRLLPRDLDEADRPLVQRLLEHLETHPLEANPERPEQAMELIDFVLRKHMRPLVGLRYFVNDPHALGEAERARLAFALGHAERATEIRMTSKDHSPALWAQYHRDRGEPTPIDAQRWQGLCGSGEDVCRVASREVEVDAKGVIAIELQVIERDAVAPYVELYVDDRLIDEGPVDGLRRFALGAAPGKHRLEVRLINRVANNNTYRLVRLSSIDS